jgi:hypothetical protein
MEAADFSETWLCSKLHCFDGKSFSLLSVHLQANKKVNEALQVTRGGYYDKL